ncbi:MAG: prolipoprotein diacylglyceryl transferase [Deltaproteobacteria bacterium]|nr:prolipoprotein diacylglyceryl transferase [Deltaproteobacteria bacterium]
MHPVLFEIGSFKLHSYGLLIAIGFLMALQWIRYRSAKEGLNPKQMTDFAFYLMLVGLVGSRIAFILVENPAYYLKRPWEAFYLWQGGLVFYGGVVAALIFSIYFFKKKKLDFWKVADILAPGLALGHAFGRLGCFMAGCCHGKTCDPHAWYGVTFPEGSTQLAPTGMPLYPTQLMESVFEFLLFGFLAWKISKKAFDGQIVLLYLIFYSLFRVGIEVLRGDLERGFIIQDYLSYSQGIGLILIVAATLFLWMRRKQSKTK